MSSGALWLAGFLAYPAAGGPLLSHRAFRPLGVPARIVLAAAAGMVAISWTMNLASIVGWKWSLPALVVSGAAECFALRFWAGRVGRVETSGETGAAATPFERVAAGVSAAAVLVAAAAALSASVTSPDLLLFWGPKAQAFAAARGIDAAYLSDPFHVFQHRSYPPLLTNLYAFSTMAAGAGRLPWMAAVATFPLFLAGLAAALPGILRQSVSRSEAAAGAAAIVAVASYVGQAYAAAGNADTALLFFEALAAAMLIGPFAETRAGQLAAGLLLAGAAAAKSEGLPFAAAAAGLFLLFRWRAALRPGTAARLLVPAVLSLAAWFAFGRRFRVFTSYETYGPALEVHFARGPLVAATIGRELAKAALAAPWAIPVLALAAAARNRSPRALYPATVALALAVFFVFTYLHGDADPTLLVAWSAGRIFSIDAVLLWLSVIATGAPAGAAGREPATPG